MTKNPPIPHLLLHPHLQVDSRVLALFVLDVIFKVLVQHRSTDMSSYYQILNLHPLSTSSDIEKAYKKQALLHHPDRNRDGDQQLATERFQRISEAYQTLKDPIRRMKYDAKFATRSRSENTYFSTSNPRHSAPVPSFKPTRSTSTPAYDPSRPSRYSAAPPPTSSKKPTPQASTHEYTPQPSRSQTRPSSRPKPTFAASFDLPRTSASKAQQAPPFEFFTQPQNSSSFEFPSTPIPRSKPTPAPDFPSTTTTTTTTLPSHRTPLSSAYTKTPSASNRPAKQANTFYANKSRASSKPIPKETTGSSFFDIFSSKGSHSSKPTESRSSTSKPTFSKSPDDPDFLASAFAHLLSKSVPDPHPIKPIIPECFRETYPKFTSPSYHQDQFSRTSHKREEFRTRPDYPVHQSYQKKQDDFSQYIPSKPRPRSYSNTPNDSLHQWRKEVASNTMKYPKVEPLSMDDTSSEGEELYGVNWPPIKSKSRSNPSKDQESDLREDRYESLFRKVDPNHNQHLFEPKHHQAHHQRNPSENFPRRRRTYSASESVSVHFTHKQDHNPNHRHHDDVDKNRYGNQEWVRKEVRTFMVQNHW
ncbi:uncharacterized protein MELLADRAFT_84222 [Melampsora larici-populina 98AG31]|uniref:J domain-containing protein n=1 Tax=Melampsora larici-populina (strain 98AG31 / pathotype 3-4-7) TaxID=747676 RepID=F4SC10_MELLP|nr:uncharacterized protein MELLADRAFT_84222 [Melampsora larici-populina 98AG31]EGF97817.1 hypothetical protein MELLADRAFT_84222 [Melampsora larici-populina 98AG31]